MTGERAIEPAALTLACAGSCPSRRSAFDDGQDVALVHDEELLAADLDLGAGVGGKQHLVVLLDLQCRALAGVEQLTVADFDHAAALGLFLGGVRQDDSTGGFLLGFQPLDEDPPRQAI